MRPGENNELSVPYKLDRKTYAGIAVVSAIYFADISLKASRKCFWFDELFTVYLCRLHDIKSIWTAVLQGADFNPPLVHLLTRGAQELFGDGLVATRLPAMIGVWLFCLCIFLFVARRAGPVCGLIAGLFPFFTLVQYYAYEARAHGIVLGWFGLLLVCWQRNAEGRSRYLWLTGFGIFLLGALLTHVYAVYILFPFFLAELQTIYHRQRPNWELVAVATLALLTVTLTVYLPMFRMYRATVPLTFFAAAHDQVQRFLLMVIGPSVGVLVIAIALFALETMRPARRTPSSSVIPAREILVASGLAFIPMLGLLGSKISHGPFIERYFLSSVAGYAIFLGFACANRQVGRWIARVLAICMLLLMAGDLVTTIYLARVNRIVLTEPSAGFALSTNPADPMQLYESVSKDETGLDILVLRQVDYLYFVRYASPAIVSRLRYGAPANDLFLGMLSRLARGADIDLKTTTFSAFLGNHDRFLAYGGNGGSDSEAMQAFVAAGYKLKSILPDAAGTLYRYEK